MSTLIEERLAAALHARSDQVQPEHLRPLDIPVVSMAARRMRTARRRRTAVVAGLAVAATAAAVASPLLFSDLGGAGSPQPTAPTSPTGSEPPRPYRLLGSTEADVDGDGVTDAATIVQQDGDGPLVLRVELGSGDRIEVTVRPDVPGGVGMPGNPLLGRDLGGGAGEELVVPVSPRESDLPVVYTWVDGEGLVVAPYPASGLQGWRADAPTNRWAVLETLLRTWEAEAVPGDGRYRYWDWYVDGRARLQPGRLQLGCAAPGDVPAPCPDEAEEGKSGVDVGPRGDLPALMPAVGESLRDERYVYGRGPASGDYAQLQGDFGVEGGAVAEGDVELVVTAMGEEHRTPVSAGQSPRLVPGVLVARGDAPVFVVERSGGDLSVLELFTFWNGELIEVEPTGEVLLGSGVVDYEGEITEQRTWVTPGGAMFTAVLLDWETRRQRLWRWNDNVGETISPTDLGEACIDWETGAYGRCP